MYVNGIAEATRTSAISLDGGSAKPFYLGGGGDSAPGVFTGYIDEFCVSKGIARWTANFTPPTEPY
jgi:hypothetical protein